MELIGPGAGNRRVEPVCSSGNQALNILLINDQETLIAFPSINGYPGKEKLLELGTNFTTTRSHPAFARHRDRISG